MAHAPLQSAMRFDWERIVRRCRISLKLKLVAYTLAQYGNVKGEGIRPGMARLAAVCEMSDKTVRRHVDQLLQLGLIECVARGGGPNRLAAQYRLTVPEDLLDRVRLLGPDELADLTPEDQPGTEVIQVTGVPAETAVTQVTGVLDPTPEPSARTAVIQVTSVPAVDNGSVAENCGHLSDRRSPVDDASTAHPVASNCGHSTRELRSKRGGTPVTQVTAHQETTQTHHPRRSPQTRPSPAIDAAVDNPIPAALTRRRPPAAATSAPTECEHGEPVRWLDTRRTVPACPDCRRATREAS